LRHLNPFDAFYDPFLGTRNWITCQIDFHPKPGFNRTLTIEATWMHGLNHQE